MTGACNADRQTDPLFSSSSKRKGKEQKTREKKVGLFVGCNTSTVLEQIRTDHFWIHTNDSEEGGVK